MLAKFGCDYYVNTSIVRSIESTTPHPRTGKNRVAITWEDGTRKIIDKPIDRLEWATGQILPAPPGYVVMEASPPDHPGTDAVFTTWPVIAFRLTDTFPVPLTPLGEMSPDSSWALIYPDGRADSPWDQVFPSVEAFKANYRGVYAAREAA